MQLETIAILGFGEAGSAIGRGLAEQSGWRTPGRRLFAIDTALEEGDVGQKIAERSERLEIDVSVGYGDHLGGADAIISVVTGEQSLAAARSAAPHLKEGTVFFDLNTVTRTMAEANAEALASSGADYVDVAVMGSFHTHGYQAPMVLAGGRAEEAAQWMTSVGFSVETLPGAAGTASAVKVLRSIMMKGIEALGVEFMVAARHQGLLEEALECTKDVDKGSFRDFVVMLVNTHVVHAKRRHEEIELVNQMLLESGLEPLMSLATERSHFRTLASGVVRPGSSVPEIEETLDILAAVVVKPGPRDHSG